MRFVCKHANYSVELRESIEEPDPYHKGRHIIHRKPLVANFVAGDLTPWEKEAALKHFSFAGMPVEEDMMTPVDPSSRLSSFDTTTQGWSPEDQEYAEKALLESQAHGPDYLHVETPKRPAPWAGYDKLRAANKIVELVEATGSDPEYVLAYERENENRDAVIAALEKLLAPVEDEEELVEA